MAEYFNLQVLRGLSSNRSILSCQAQGLVDLWTQDDASGRQRWLVTQVQGQAEDVYTIATYKGTDSGKSFLGVAADNMTVELQASDDGSGRQRWKLVPVDSVASVLEIPSYYLIESVLKSGQSGDCLSCTEDGTRVDLWFDDGSGRQRWQVQGPGFDPDGPPS